MQKRDKKGRQNRPARVRAVDWRRDQERGTTLVEVVLAVAIFSLIMTIALAFYSCGLQSWSRGISASDLQQNARIAMDVMIRELRYARHLDGFQDGGTLPLPLYRHGLAEQRGAGSLRYTDVEGSRSELSFNKAKRIVTLKTKRGSPNEIAYNVTGLDFFHYVPRGGQTASSFPDSRPLLLVCIRMQGKAQGQQEGASYTLQSVVRLQNLPLFNE